MSEPSNPPDPQKKLPGKKADKATIAQRIEQVLRLRLDGFQFHEIVQYGADPARNWGINERQIRKYIAAADQFLVERMDRKRKPLIARHIAQREALYARCIAAGDYRTALGVLADLAKLKDLYPDKRLKECYAAVRSLQKQVEEFKARRGDGGICPPIPGAGTMPASSIPVATPTEPHESSSGGGGIDSGPVTMTNGDCPP